MDFESYTEEQQAYFLIDSKEHYLSYALLIQSGNHYRKLKMDLHNDFTTVNKIYPNSCPQNLHMLDKYSKIYLRFLHPKESSFSQGYYDKGNGVRGVGN